jgi:hypothetical protein
MTAAHFCSQFVYLNPPLRWNGVSITVGEMARFYGENPVGQRMLTLRFQKIPQELELWRAFVAGEALAFGDWRLAQVLDDNGTAQSGFYGCSFLSPAGERVVAFRGSELLGNPDYRNDYESDFALAYTFPTPQQAMVEQYWRRFPAEGETLVTGHSLGGNLALYGTISAPSATRRRIGGCYAFNAPGFCDDYIAGRAAALEEVGERLFLLQNRYDPVSSLLRNVVEPQIIASKVTPRELEKEEDEGLLQSLFYPHSNFLYETDENGVLISSETQKKSAFCRAVNLLTEKLLLLPVEARKDLADTLLDALYGTPSGTNPADHALTKLTSLTAHNHRFGAGAGLELAGSIFSGAAMLKSGGIRGLFARPEEDEPEEMPAAKALPLFIHTLCNFIGK